MFKAEKPNENLSLENSGKILILISEAGAFLLLLLFVSFFPIARHPFFFPPHLRAMATFVTCSLLQGIPTHARATGRGGSFAVEANFPRPERIIQRKRFVYLEFIVSVKALKAFASGSVSRGSWVISQHFPTNFPDSKRPGITRHFHKLRFSCLPRPPPPLSVFPERNTVHNRSPTRPVYVFALPKDEKAKLSKAKCFSVVGPWHMSRLKATLVTS